jgi:hypothetical protein
MLWRQAVSSRDSKSVSYSAFEIGRPASAEKRRAPRKNVRCVGLIYDDQGSIVAQCVMTDISAGGAKLEMEAGFDVPDWFILTLSRNAGVRRNCRVAWRRDTSIGVRFVAAPR